jgi:AraC-like DNA-binding protein
VLDGLSMLSGETQGHLARRNRSLLADGNDDLVFATNRSGFSLLSQRGRECRLDPGSAALLSSAEPGAQDFPGPASPLNLRIRQRQLAALVSVPEDALIRPIPAGTEALRLLVDYVDVAVRRHQFASPQLQHVFTTHVYDLIALAIGATRDASEAARDRGLRAARLNAAQGEIMRRLDEEELAVADVAGRLGVTPRYVQRLFEAEGTTFTEYVTRQRLARAYRMLADPRFRDRTVTAVAFEVGFGNLSHFNRLFRRAYGATPSDVRASAPTHMRLDA